MFHEKKYKIFSEINREALRHGKKHVKTSGRGQVNQAWVRSTSVALPNAFPLYM